MPHSVKKQSYITLAISVLFSVFVVIALVFLNGVVSKLNTETESLAHDMVHGNHKAIDAMIKADVSTITNYAACSSKYKNRVRVDLMSELKKLTEDSGMLNIIIIDEQGESISHRNEKINVSHREYFKKAMNGEIVISESIYSEPDQRMVNVIAAPIYGDYQRVIGVVAGMCNSDVYKDVLNLSVKGHENNAVGYVIDSNGNVLMEGNNLFGDYVPVKDNLFESVFLKNLTEQEITLLKDEFNKKESHGMVSVDTDNGKYVSYYTTFSVDENLHYFVIFPADVVYGKLDEYISKTLILFLFFIGVLALIVIAYFVFTYNSFKALKKANEEITKVAYEDTLTGYGTWGKFEKDAQYLLSQSYRKYAFVSFDIDKFKAINDMFGHEEGNRILKQIADVVNRNLNNHETFSRINSDNFYLLLVYKSDEDMAERIKRIIYALEYEITNFAPVISFGIYRITDNKLTIRKMGDLADIAKRTVKYGERSSYAFYNEEMLKEIREEKHIENEMQNALDSHEFCVYFQPKVSLGETPYLMGAEALVRWIKNDTVVSPAKFIPLFERNGFIVKLDYYVMEQVCYMMKTWESLGYKDIMISVNMSRVHLADPAFPDTLKSICDDYAIPTSRIEIEITESAAFESLEVLTKVFDKLKSLGFHISIDDFGSGYSSLNMLKDLPADVLKIDRAFLTESVNNKRANDIIAYVIKMARSLGMETICEGIESNEQVTLLKRLGCDMAQGYYYARPMAPHGFEEILKKKHDTIKII
ncbi:MAG: EAL domain-containing protein [Ruminiclostridium sp.]|nr:EAL domain-containing protein [Ruminiclostridium sp.]